MLLEKLGSIQCTSRNKMLPGEGAFPKFETTAEGTGTLGGSNVKSLATYRGGIRADGFLEGEVPNSGVIMADDGVATFRATAIGSFTEDGGSSWKGVVYFNATAPSLASLNGVAVAFTWDVDGDGNAIWELWALK
jgi:hypothetical protein